MSSNQTFSLRGSIHNLCNQPVILKTGNKGEARITQDLRSQPVPLRTDPEDEDRVTTFTHEGRLALDIAECNTFAEPGALPIRKINHFIPLYAPSPAQAEITLSEIAAVPYLGEFPVDPKHGPAIFYIVPRIFLCFALSRRWDFTSRLLILERDPDLGQESADEIKIYDPKAKKRPTGRLVSAMNYNAPPEFRYWLQDRDISLISDSPEG